MKRPKEKFAMQKLTTKNLYLVIMINILLPFFSCLLIEPIKQIQLSRQFIDNVTVTYYLKMIFLILILDVVILAVLDYWFILLPFHRIETLIKEYEENPETIVHDMDTSKSWLEKNFLDILTAWREMDESTRKKEEQIQTTKLYALQTQINPHFLYNTLDSIRGYALIHHVDEIAHMTEAISRLFRSMVAEEGKLLLLREEFECVNSYITIQNFRFHQKFHYTCDVPDELMDKYMIPNMSLQPIVENAIMHGLEPNPFPGKIQIKGYVTEKRLVLSVYDNGNGIEEEKLNYLNEMMQNYREVVDNNGKYHVGIALININKRIKLRFGKEYGIYISSTPNIFTMTELILPVIPFDEKNGGGNGYE